MRLKNALSILLLPLVFAACSFEDETSVPNLVVGISHVMESRFEHFNDCLTVNSRLALAKHSDNGIVRTSQGPVRIQFLTMPVVRKEHVPRQVFFEAANNYDLKLVLGNICPLTGQGMANAAEELRIPYISPVAASPAIIKGKRFSFPTSPTMDERAMLYARFMHRQLGARKVALLAQKDSLAGMVYAEALRRYFSSEGGELVAMAEFDSLSEIPSLLPALVAAAPDAILHCPIAPHIFAIGRELEQLGYTGPLVGVRNTQAFAHETHLPQPGLPIYFLSYWNPEDRLGEQQGYVQAFKEKTGRTPSEDDVFVYDSCLRLIRAVGEAQDLSALSLQKALLSQDMLDGVVGTYSFKPSPGLEKLWRLFLLDGSRRMDQIQLSEPGAAPAPLSAREAPR